MKQGRRLNWRQACAILGCGKNRFYQLVNLGFLPAYRLPGSKRGLFVFEADCRRLLQRIEFGAE